jgi:HK97 gp10 family phage protein
MVLNQKVIASKIERAQKRLLTIGFMISRSAKQFCPSDTGRLRASISVNWSGSGKIRGSTDSFTKALKVTSHDSQLDVGSLNNDGIGQPSSIGHYQVVVGTNVRYAPFVEFGTSKMGNTPFLRAGFEENRAIIDNMGTMSRAISGDVVPGGTLDVTKIGE